MEIRQPNGAEAAAPAPQKSPSARPHSEPVPAIPKESVTLSPSATQAKVNDGMAARSKAPAQPAPHAKWTVLAYLAGDNDLEPFVAKNMKDLEQAGSSKDVNVVVQLDRGPHPSDSSGSTNAARYYVVRDDKPSTIDSPIVGRLGPTNMADPKALKNFLAWGMKNYPADHYLVILNDHGGGFQGALEDDTSHAWMSTPSIGNALQGAETRAGVAKDRVVVGFDACLMDQAEVAYQMKDAAKIMVASEELIGGSGWPYTQILASAETAAEARQIHASQRRAGVPLTGDSTPENLANGIVAETAKHPKSTVTMAALDLSKAPALKGALNALGEALLATKTPTSDLRKAFKAAQHYSVGVSARPYTDIRDAYDLAQRLAHNPDIKDPAVKRAATGLMDAVRQIVITEQHVGPGMEHSHGLSIYAPTKKGGLDGLQYNRLALTQDTTWEQALERFTGPAKPTAGKTSHAPVHPPSTELSHHMPHSKEA